MSNKAKKIRWISLPEKALRKFEANPVSYISAAFVVFTTWDIYNLYIPGYYVL